MAIESYPLLGKLLGGRFASLVAGSRLVLKHAEVTGANTTQNIAVSGIKRGDVVAFVYNVTDNDDNAVQAGYPQAGVIRTTVDTTGDTLVVAWFTRR
jgi:hypothetical protein